MVYKRNFNAEAEIRELRDDLRALTDRKPGRATLVSSQTARIIRQRADRAMEIVDEQAVMLVNHEARIDQLERMVAQLIGRGRIPCQEQSYSRSSPSPSLRSVSSY